MPPAVAFKLHDLLGVAGATVIFILVGAILMGGFNAKYVQLFERYRGLTGELRQNPMGERRQSLLDQIISYRRRIRFIQIASVSIGVAVLLFLMTVIVASISVISPTTPFLRTFGAVGVLGGLFASVVGVAIDLLEIFLSGPVIREEIADIPEVPKDDRFTT